MLSPPHRLDPQATAIGSIALMPKRYAICPIGGGSSGTGGGGPNAAARMNASEALLTLASVALSDRLGDNGLAQPAINPSLYPGGYGGLGYVG